MGKYKNDIILAAGVILLAAALFLAYLLWSGGRGGIIEVTMDGEVYKRFSLDKDQEEEISTSYGKNRLIIEGGSAYIKEADCPDKICVRQGKISKKGQTIICLPHKIAITVIEGEEGDIDAVAGK